MGAFPTKDLRPTCFELHTELGCEVFASVTLCKENVPLAECNLFQKFYRLRCEPHVRHWVNANVARDQLKAPPPKDEVYTWHIQHASLALDRAVSGDGGPVPLPILILKLEPALLQRCLPRFSDDDPLKCHFSWNGIRLNLSDLEDYPEESTAVAKVGFRAFNEKGIGGTKAVEGSFYAREYWTTGYATAFLQRACQLYLNGDQGLNSVPTQFESSMLATDAWLLLLFWKLFAILGTTITTDLKLKFHPSNRNPEKVTFLLGSNAPGSTALDAAKKLNNSSFPQSYHRDVMSVEAEGLTKLAVDQSRQQSEALQRHFELLVESMKQWEASNAILAQYDKIRPAPLGVKDDGSVYHRNILQLVTSLEDFGRSIEALELHLGDFKTTVKRILREAPHGAVFEAEVEEDLLQYSKAIWNSSNNLHGQLEVASQQAESLLKQHVEHADRALDSCTLRNIAAEIRSLQCSCEDIRWTWNEFSAIVDLPLICLASRLPPADPTHLQTNRLAYAKARQSQWKNFFTALLVRRDRTNCCEKSRLVAFAKDFSQLDRQDELLNLRDQRASLRLRLVQLQELGQWLAEYIGAIPILLPQCAKPEPSAVGGQSGQLPNLPHFQDCFPTTLRWDLDEGDFQVVEELKGKMVRRCTEMLWAEGMGRDVVLKSFRDPQELRKELHIMKHASHQQRRNGNSGIGSFYYAFEVGYNESPPATEDPSRPLPQTPPILFDKFSYIMVMPYYPCKSTDWFSARVQRGEWVAFVQGLIEVAKAVQELHELGFIHGDLKPEHILFDSHDGKSGRPKLIGFGASRMDEVEKAIPEMDPVREKNRLCFSTEVFELGKVFATFLEGAESTLEGKGQSGFGSDRTPTLKRLFLRMLAQNPAERPKSFEEIIDNLNLMIQPGLASRQLFREVATLRGKRRTLLSEIQVKKSYKESFEQEEALRATLKNTLHDLQLRLAKALRDDERDLEADPHVDMHLFEAERLDIDIGDFMIIDALEEGAVSLAVETAGLGNVVVVKRFWHEQHFLAELSVMSRAKQKNIGTFLYYFQDRPLQEFYLVMPYYPVSSSQWVSERLRKGEYTELMSGFASVACGLAALHRVEILHCDLKESNIMFESDHPLATPKLIDFEISKRRDANSVVGVRGFTRGYLAPELEGPDGRPLPWIAPTPASDIYALGITFSRLLSIGLEMECLPETLAQLLKSMISQDPELRPEAAKVARLLEGRGNDAVGDRHGEVPQPFAVSVVLRRQLQALELNPKDAKTWLKVGNALPESATVTVHGQLCTRTDCFVHAVQLNPSDPDLWTSLGASLAEGTIVSMNGKADATRSDCFLEALRLNELNPDSWNNYGASLAPGKVGYRNLTKIQCFEHALKLNPEKPAYWRNLGMSLAKDETVVMAGRTTTGLDCFVKALELDPTNPQSWNNVACSLPENATVSVKGSVFPKSQCHGIARKLSSPSFNLEWATTGSCEETDSVCKKS